MPERESPRDARLSDQIHEAFLSTQKIARRKKSDEDRDYLLFVGGLITGIEASKTHRITAIRAQTGGEIFLRESPA